MGWQVTDFNPKTDLDAVAALHDRANAQQSGTIARTRAYWDMAPSRIRGVSAGPSSRAEMDTSAGISTMRYMIRGYKPLPQRPQKCVR